jgi:glycosyltransferase involved in cell wall biosynthesis
MSGRIVFREGMFEKRQKTDFDKIKFVTSGSCYGNKGQLSIELALISFYNTFFKKSPEKYRDFEINIIGLDKDIKNYYSRTITEAAPGLDGRINLYHHMSQSEAFDIFKDSNLTITYSLEESFSMVTVEGMAYGHPIIRSDNSGSEEQLKEGKNGWKVSTKDWYGLVLAFEDLLNKEKTSNQKLLDMSNESIKIAKANYNSKYKIVEDIEHFINQLN